MLLFFPISFPFSSGVELSPLLPVPPPAALACTRGRRQRLDGGQAVGPGTFALSLPPLSTRRPWPWPPPTRRSLASGLPANRCRRTAPPLAASRGTDSGVCVQAAMTRPADVTDRTKRVWSFTRPVVWNIVRLLLILSGRIQGGRGWLGVRSLPAVLAGLWRRAASSRWNGLDGLIFLALLLASRVVKENGVERAGCGPHWGRSDGIKKWLPHD
ncbi:hypothetical protein BKA80DRAFT_84637 [Phyllosticta citrichinensis]